MRKKSKLSPITIEQLFEGNETDYIDIETIKQVAIHYVDYDKGKKLIELVIPKEYEKTIRLIATAFYENGYEDY